MDASAKIAYALEKILEGQNAAVAPRHPGDAEWKAYFGHRLLCAANNDKPCNCGSKPALPEGEK